MRCTSHYMQTRSTSSPIGSAWSEFKAILRAQEACSVDTLKRALSPALDAIWAQNVGAWF
ncbi:hypothetical protein DM194_27765 (plasmid) [Azospirillum ramasamyi]|uniref:Transposase n=1 Tax=Azospirillum ramasamyi TaxID=682998 RepID=A0A2U9SHC3_9PROT|nr:hypothetical protein DM194_27765 [Azospirillum ramasamyi]